MSNIIKQKYLDYFKFCEDNDLTINDFKSLQKFFNQGAV